MMYNVYSQLVLDAFNCNISKQIIPKNKKKRWEEMCNGLCRKDHIFIVCFGDKE